MSAHLPVLPILIPLLTGVALLIAGGASDATKRTISGLSLVLLVASAIAQVMTASDGQLHVYRLGNWPAPYGIVLVLDRLSALMVMLTTGLAVAVYLASLSGTDLQGRQFHAFLHFQLLGLNGAFLTGDLFNLFVFFEILLLASYVLLAHGSGLQRTRAGLSYVILNLTGSALFLIALGLLYGYLGTLNMADFGVALAKVEPADQPVVMVMCVLLASVFLFKAAVLPIGFWLPHVYTAATLPVAALFVIMTKVGIYALLRVVTIGFLAAPFTAGALQPWLMWLAAGTVALGVVGSLAASSLGGVTANLVLVSGGTLLIAVAEPGSAAISAALYYLVQTTLVTGALFLMAYALARQRGDASDRLVNGPRFVGITALSLVYLILGVAVSGAPPLSGFLGKIMMLEATQSSSHIVLIWSALILSGFAAALVLARAASILFWEPSRIQSSDQVPARQDSATGLNLALGIMVLSVVAVTVAAAPIAAYARATADQILSRETYVQAVIGDPGAVERVRRP